MQSRPTVGRETAPTAGGPNRAITLARLAPVSSARAWASVIELRFCALRSSLSTCLTPWSTALPTNTPQATHPPIPSTMSTPTIASTMISTRVPFDDDDGGGGPEYG